MYTFGIGHKRLSYSFRLKQEEQPQCIACLTPYTVKYFYLQSAEILLPLDKVFVKANNTKDIFENDNMDDFMSFLREIRLRQKSKTRPWSTPYKVLIKKTIPEVFDTLLKWNYFLKSPNLHKNVNIYIQCTQFLHLQA